MYPNNSESLTAINPKEKEEVLIKHASIMLDQIANLDYKEQVSVFQHARRMLIERRESVIKDCTSDIEAIQFKMKTISEGNSMLINQL